MDERLYLNIALSPYCFDFEFLQQDAFFKPSKLRETLQIIKEKSLWIQDKYKTKNLIYSIVQNYQNQGFKKDIEELLEVISNKIIHCYDGDFTCENSWENAIPNHVKNYLHHIIKQENLSTKTIDKDSRGIPIEQQDKEIVKKFLQPIIPYSKIIKIYDPYFSLYQHDRNQRFLNIILNLINENPCNIQKPLIEIYSCSCSNRNEFFYRNNIIILLTPVFFMLKFFKIAVRAVKSNIKNAILYTYSFPFIVIGLLAMSRGFIKGAITNDARE